MRAQRDRCEVPARALVMALAVSAVGLTACPKQRGKADSGTDGLDSARGALLSAAGACALTTAREFLPRATELEAAATALAAQPSATTREAAREAFRRALDAWEVAEPMQFGPAAPGSVAGGQELRDNIYAWPLVSRCSVEEQVVARGYESPDFGTSLVTRRGLVALEYLLFYEGADTACAASSPIVSSGSWAALGSDERESRKRAYAVAAAAEVRRRAAQLVDAWDPAKGDFSGRLASAGPGNDVYRTAHAALNSVSDALFYVEHEVKDVKIARPLGLRDCPTATCPELLESPFAARSKANVRANLVGFRRIIEGCGPGFEGYGFDDLLEAVGAGPLAAKLRDRGAAAQASLEAIDEPDLKEALVADPPSVRAMYDGLKGVTDVLKTELMTVLDLELPKSLEGDND
jgi:uncharacterized protein